MPPAELRPWLSPRPLQGQNDLLPGYRTRQVERLPLLPSLDPRTLFEAPGKRLSSHNQTRHQPFPGTLHRALADRLLGVLAQRRPTRCVIPTAAQPA
jgi:hypothetical protein